MGWRTGARKGSGPLTLGAFRFGMERPPLSHQRSRVQDDDIGAVLNADRVFVAAQVTLFVKLILTVLLLDPRSVDTFTLPKSVAAHATSLVLAALLVWLLGRYGRRLLFWSPAH